MGDDDLFSSSGSDDEFFSEPSFGEEGGDASADEASSGDIASDFGGADDTFGSGDDDLLGGSESLPELDTPQGDEPSGKKKSKLNLNMDRKTILLLVLLLLVGGAGGVYTYFPGLIEEFLPEGLLPGTEVAQAPTPTPKKVAPKPAPKPPVTATPTPAKPAPAPPATATPAPAKPAPAPPATATPAPAKPAPAPPVTATPAPAKPAPAPPATATPAPAKPAPAPPATATPAPAKPAPAPPATATPAPAKPAPAPPAKTTPPKPAMATPAPAVQPAMTSKVVKAKLPVAKKGYYVQSGAFLFKENLAKPKKKITSLGYKPEIKVGRKTVTMNRLLVGNWGDFLEAEAVEKALKKEGYSASLISKNERFSVLIGSFYYKKTALKKKRALTKKGYKARIERSPIRMKVHHLLTGPYSRSDEAAAVANKLNRSGVKSVVLQAK